MSDAFSQCISIELSIKWKNEVQNYRKNVLQYNPYLVITYRNNTDSSLYFLKISRGYFGFPQFISGGTTEMVNKLTDIEKLHDYSMNKYNVIIGGISYSILSWEVLSDTLNNKIEHEINPINDILADMYWNIFKEMRVDNFKNDTIGLSYNFSDITEVGILNKLRDNFVFLEARGEYSEYYNLFGFKMIGGHYCFSASSDTLNSFVYTDPFWNKNKGRWIYKIASLPNRINNYNLYSGRAITNRIEIEFPLQKRK